MAKYKVHHPEHYPIAWISAARIAVEYAGSADPWVEVDWAKGVSGAVARMKRLRSFRDGLKAHPTWDARLGRMMAEGWGLTFRRRKLYGVWSVELCWALEPEGLGETLREVLGESLPPEEQKSAKTSQKAIDPL